MCDPLTITIAATALAAAGTGMQAASAASQASYAGKVADRNASMEDAAAVDAIERGKLESQRYQREASQVQGAQRVALAANGIDVDFGSAAALRTDTARLQGEDAQTIRENSLREARGFEISAANYRAGAAGNRAAASSAALQGVFGVGSTVLGGVQQYKRMDWKRKRSGT